MSDEVTDKQMSWFEYRHDYSPAEGASAHFYAGYDAALRDLGKLPSDPGYPDA